MFFKTSDITYKRINEDFLDKHDIQSDSINVLDDAELDDWVRYGKKAIIPSGDIAGRLLSSQRKNRTTEAHIESA